MARAANRLTAVSAAKATKPGRYADGLGLYLFIGPTGGKSWVFRYRKAGRLHDMGLGPLHTISLAEARARALELRRARLDGRDPLEEKATKRAQAGIADAKAMTFEQCAEAYIRAQRAGWRDTDTAKQWRASLGTYVHPVFGGLPVQAIDVSLIMKTLEPIWTVRTETASRVRGRIESILGWATVRGYREGDNPARWRGHLDNLLPKKSKVRAVKHHAALPYTDIADFIIELRRRRAISARALEFAILTGTRTGEAIGARWEEINFAERLWAVPSGRMKAGKEHRIPLSDAALAILEELAKLRHGDSVFPGQAGASIKEGAMRMLLHYMGRSNLTVHGFRSSFRDWAAERTNFPREVCEAALAHAIDNAVEAAYRRGDLFQKRRQLMDAWGRYCASPATDGAPVIPLAAAGRVR
jgi:integrase